MVRHFQRGHIQHFPDCISSRTFMLAFLCIIVSTFSVDPIEVYAIGPAFLPQLQTPMALTSWNLV